MVIPIESFDKFVASIVFFVCGIWLYCAYEKGGRTNLILKGLLAYFMLMAASNIFEAAGMLFLLLDAEEVSVPLYNASYVIANTLLFFACAKAIGVALESYFEKTELRVNAKTYCSAVIVIFGLVIIIVSAFYQAKPSFDSEKFLINTNYDPFVYKMMIAIILISMMPASLFFTAKAFFASENKKAHLTMGLGAGISLIGLFPIDSVQNIIHVILIDVALMAGSLMLFYGANTIDVFCRHRADLINK